MGLYLYYELTQNISSSHAYGPGEGIEKRNGKLINHFSAVLLHDERRRAAVDRA